MSNDRFASAHEMVREYVELEAKMADPSIHEDQANARKLGRRYAQLGPVVAGFKAWKSAEDDLLAAAELADVDPDFAAEIPALEAARDAAAEKLEELLLPRDPNDDRDVILEVKAGAGGDESALFAGDLLRMYIRNRSPANSADSSPPAPALTSKITSRSSLGSRGNNNSSNRSAAASRAASSAGISAANSGSTSANSAAANKSSSDDFHALKPATTGPSCA